MGGSHSGLLSRGYRGGLVIIVGHNDCQFYSRDCMSEWHSGLGSQILGNSEISEGF